jgi:Fur family ferric uptake transcriptional regulator
MTTKTPRTTKQRTAVLELLDEVNEFRTAQELHQLLAERGDTIGLATVYRTLSRMAAAEEVDTLLNSDGETLYRRCSSGHHHHLVCVDCGTAVEISARAVESWAQQMGAEHGFTDIHHTVELSGRCQKCSTTR